MAYWPTNGPCVSEVCVVSVKHVPCWETQAQSAQGISFTLAVNVLCMFVGSCSQRGGSSSETAPSPLILISNFFVELPRDRSRSRSRSRIRLRARARLHHS